MINSKKITYIFVFILLTGIIAFCVFGKKDKVLVNEATKSSQIQHSQLILDEFSKLSQEEKRKILPFMLDGLDHEMYGIGLSKTREDFKKSGGHSGYYISHYPSYTSGGLAIPVLRVYNHKKKLVETLVGGPISKDGKSLLNLGGFSKPYDFRKVVLNGKSEFDQIEAKIRGEILYGMAQNISQKHYSADSIKNYNDDNFTNVNVSQNALSGTGYDLDCIHTTIREVKEESGMNVNIDSLILLDIHSSVLDQETKSGYKIQTSSTGVCCFMFEIGSITLDKGGKIKNIAVKSDTILNISEIMHNFSKHTGKKYDKVKILMDGMDDAESGIIFTKLNSLKRIFASNNKSYNFEISDKQNNKYKIVASIGDVMKMVPKNTQYKTCRPITFRTIGKILPSQNDINAQEVITRYKPRMICNE